jgi:hypothetical protein
MIIEPIGIAHLHETGRSVAHEQELRITEAILEIGKKGRLAARYVIGIVLCLSTVHGHAGANVS